MDRHTFIFFPKGVIVDMSGNVVFADGRRLRKIIKSNGTIVTIAGRPQINEWRPPTKCQMEALSTSLQWPTALTINPIDESIYFLDGEEILTYKMGAIYRLASCYS